MSLAALMRQEVTLHRPLTDTRDEIGGVSTATETTTTVTAYLEPVIRGSRVAEDLADRNTGVGDWLLLVPATVDIHNWDTVTYDGRTFEIVSPVRPMPNPRTGAVSHIECDLQEVQT